MAIYNINKNRIPLKAYLKADSNSQRFKFRENSEELVSPEMFWGYPEGIYLDYTKMGSRSINVSEGISVNTGTHTLRNLDCDEWIENHMCSPHTSKLFVIEGYAGCGKTTFINHLIRTSPSFSNHIYIDVGEHWAYIKEPHMFFQEALDALGKLISEILAKPFRIRNKIWNSFFDISKMPEKSYLGSEVYSAINILKSSKTKSHTKKFQDNILQDLDERYGQKSHTRHRATKNRQHLWHSKGQTQIIVMLIILLKCAEFFVEAKDNAASKKFSIVFDNLDIITDPSIPAENVLLLWDVIDRYTKFKTAYYARTNNTLPDFIFFIMVRKVLYAHITSHLPHLEMHLPYDASCVCTCDISNIYSSQDILAHRISYWSKHTEDQDTIEKFSQIEKLISIQSCGSPTGESIDAPDYIPKASINLDAFVNHNYRALTNALSALLDNPKYTMLLMSDYNSETTERWQKVATLVFSLSLLYRTKTIWSSMGFGCTDYDLADFPTTLNRLVLNYLYSAKQGQNLCQYALNYPNISTNPNVPLAKIVASLSKVRFLPSDVKRADDELIKEYKSAVNETKDLIFKRVADMCARTPGSSTAAFGYDAEDDELWRRPLYFTGGLALEHTAASHEELSEHFRKSIEKTSVKQITLSITDEGFMLINDIVATFEFYSARYCDISVAKPLHQATSESELDSLIQPVYEAVQRCCKRTIFFKDQYLEQYHSDLNQFLRQSFHPRTKPRLIMKDERHKKLDRTSFRPQIHIVRVIYAHIGYLNMVKKSFSNLKESTAMCERLTKWIADYLLLYETYFYHLLKDSTYSSDNYVYNALHTLTNLQLKQYAPGGNGHNIDISVATYRAKYSRH